MGRGAYMGTLGIIEKSLGRVGIGKKFYKDPNHKGKDMWFQSIIEL